MELIRLNCCGILEVNGIADWEAKETLKTILFVSSDDDIEILNHCAWVIFSQANGGTYGDAFAAWLEDAKLGTVVHLESTLNKNSGNLIDVFCWRVDHAALGKWMEMNWTASDPIPPDCNCPMCRTQRSMSASL